MKVRAPLKGAPSFLSLSILSSEAGKREFQIQMEAKEYATKGT